MTGAPRLMMAPTPEGLCLSEPKCGTFMERVGPKALELLNSSLLCDSVAEINPLVDKCVAVPSGTEWLS